MPDDTTSTDTGDDKPVDTGDGPSSHDTSGVDPAADVRGGDDAPDLEGDGPASNETSGVDPAAEVAATHGGYTTVQTGDAGGTTVGPPDDPGTSTTVGPDDHDPDRGDG